MTANFAEPTEFQGSAATTFRFAVIFMGLTGIFLLPAALNGFPLVMEDSIGYSGQGVGWIRSATAAVLIARVYEVIGYWALPLFNALINAAAWVLLLRAFNFRSAWLILPVSFLALQPLYTSAVLVDAWFFPAIIFLIVSVRWKSPFLALSAGVLLSGHGSGLLLGVAFLVLAALLLGFRRAALMPLLAIATTVGINAYLDHKFFPELPPLSKTFVAARFFSVHTDLLRRECSRSGEALLCDSADLIDQLKTLPENDGRRDYFWDMARTYQERFSLIEFEREHAKPIILDALSFRVFDTAFVIAGDFLSFYGPGTKLDFNAKLGEPMPPAYDKTHQAEGFWTEDGTRAGLTALRFALYVVVVAAFLFGWQQTSSENLKWIVLIVLICLANDALFAILSGPPDRYHHRILPLYAAAACLMWLPGRNREA